MSNTHKRNTPRDSWVRSWTKAFTWRVIGIVILVVLSYAVTGSWAKASLITIAYHGVQVVLYVFHERAWALTDWGQGTIPSMFWFYFWLIILILAFALVVIIGGLEI